MILVFDSLGWKHNDGLRVVEEYLMREAVKRNFLRSIDEGLEVDVRHVLVSRWFCTCDRSLRLFEGPTATQR